MGNLFCLTVWSDAKKNWREHWKDCLSGSPKTIKLTEKSGLTDARGVGGVGASPEAEVASQRADAPSPFPQDPPQPC